MRYWVAKAQPQEWEPDGYYRRGAIGDWFTARPPKDWAPGDKVFFWKSSPARKIVALGRIDLVGYERASDGKAHFRVTYLTPILDNPVGLAALRSSRVLRTASFVQPGPVFTLYPLTYAQARELYRLVTKANPRHAGLWRSLRSDSARRAGVREVTEPAGRRSQPPVDSRTGALAPPRVWWCNQGRCWRHERAAEVVCASGEATERGLKFRRTAGEVKRGDIVVHYVSSGGRAVRAISRARTDGRSERIDLRGYGVAEPNCHYGRSRGWVFEADYHDLDPPIPIEAVAAALARLEIDDGPIIADGRVRQAYLMPFSLEGLKVLRRESDAPWPKWAEAALDGRRPTRRARPRTVSGAARTLDVEGAFDPTSEQDAREHAMRSIALRRGQPEFRSRLLNLYGGRCAITGADAKAALEAAHIVPYRGKHTNHPTNGILLRADLHTLFDQGLIAIDPKTMRVLVSPELRRTQYWQYHGAEVRSPRDGRFAPSAEALAQHRRLWKL